MAAHKSLREEILEAPDTDTIEALLDLGSKPEYDAASTRTRSRWRSAARKRRAQLKEAK